MPEQEVKQYAGVELMEIARKLPYSWGRALECVWESKTEEEVKKGLQYAVDALTRPPAPIEKSDLDGMMSQLAACRNRFDAAINGIMSSIVLAAAGGVEARKALTFMAVQMDLLPVELLEEIDD